MFGYCGNDFSAIKRMDPLIVEQIEKTTVSIGQWMHSVGYRGAFGVDYLLDGGTLRFTEINPRFQGSTRVSAYLSLQRDEPCILIDHIAAMLHFEPISRAPLADAIQNTPDTAHIVLHDSQKLDNRGRLPSIVEGVQKIGGRADVIIGQEMPADNGCVLASFTLPTHVTNDGFHLFEAVEGIFDVREKG